MARNPHLARKATAHVTQAGLAPEVTYLRCLISWWNPLTRCTQPTFVERQALIISISAGCLSVR